MTRKRRICLPFVVLLFVAIFYSQSNAQGILKKLPGTWKADLELTKKYYKEIGEDLPDSLKRQIPNLLITFEKDGGLRIANEQGDGPKFEIEGKWEKLEIDESKKVLRLKLIPESVVGPPETEFEIKFLKFDMQEAVAVVPDDEDPIVFKRGGKEKAKPKKKKTPEKNSDKDLKKERTFNKN